MSERNWIFGGPGRPGMYLDHEGVGEGVKMTLGVQYDREALREALKVGDFRSRLMEVARKRLEEEASAALLAQALERIEELEAELADLKKR